MSEFLFNKGEVVEIDASTLFDGKYIVKKSDNDGVVLRKFRWFDSVFIQLKKLFKEVV